MTAKLRHTCGYEICIITKYVQVDLNRFITIIVTDLQQKSVGRKTRKVLFSTTSASHYKDKLFPDGEC